MINISGSMLTPLLYILYFFIIASLKNASPPPASQGLKTCSFLPGVIFDITTIRVLGDERLWNRIVEIITHDVDGCPQSSMLTELACGDCKGGSPLSFIRKNTKTSL